MAEGVSWCKDLRLEGLVKEVKSRLDGGKKVALVRRWTGAQNGYSARAGEKELLLPVEGDLDIVLVWLFRKYFVDSRVVLLATCRWRNVGGIGVGSRMSRNGRRMRQRHCRVQARARWIKSAHVRPPASQVALAVFTATKLHRTGAVREIYSGKAARTARAGYCGSTTPNCG